ncbi:MAG: ABC transporter permease [Pirellulaceae bacterium]|nr:MAG: ABC transporter permease [Pirellulaceae bacterium]
MKHKPTRSIQLIVPPLVVAGLLLSAWQLTVWVLHVKPYLLPGPTSVLAAMGRGWWELLIAALLTARCAVVGFLICLVAGTTLGLLFAHFPFLRRGLYPYAVFFQTVPIIAVAPLVINWLGPGFTSIVAVVVIVGLFPVMAAVVEGVLSVDYSLRELFRVCQADRWQVLWKLELPAVIPFLVTGARTSSGLCVIGAIVGEFFAGHSTRAHGLGYIIPQRIQWLKTDEAFAAVFVAVGLGLLMFMAVSAARNGPLRRYCRS